MTGPRSRLLATVLVVLLAGLLAWAPAARAHVSVVGTTPSAGATLDTAPDRVAVRFDSALLDVGYALVVRSEDGRTVSTGPVELGRTSVAVAVDPDAGPGRYTVGFRVVSADGHEVSSSFDYAVTSAGVEVPGDSTAPNPPEPQHGGVETATSRWTPALVGAIAATALAGAALLAWALLARRRRQ